MSRLYTITANLLAETTVVYAGVRPGETHRARDELFQVGGKGINVSRMAARLGWETTALCFPGGDTGARCLRWLAEQPFAIRAFSQREETRAGWVVRAGGEETTFLGMDRPVEPEAWSEAMEFLKRVVEPGDVVAFCGSIPGWSAMLAQVLRGLMEAIEGRAFLAVDTYGAPLEELARLPVDLVKVNLAELAPLAGGVAEVESILSNPETAAAKRWVVTDGGNEVTVRDEEGATWKQSPSPVKVVSAVGSGDVMLAGLLWSLTQQNHSLEDSVALGMELGRLNAASPGVAEFEVPVL